MGNMGDINNKELFCSEYQSAIGKLNEEVLQELAQISNIRMLMKKNQE